MTPDQRTEAAMFAIMAVFLTAAGVLALLAGSWIGVFCIMLALCAVALWIRLNWQIIEGDFGDE